MTTATIQLSPTDFYSLRLGEAIPANAALETFWNCTEARVKIVFDGKSDEPLNHCNELDK